MRAGAAARHAGKSLVLTVGESPFDDQILSLDIAEFIHSPRERAVVVRIERSWATAWRQETDPPDFALRLREKSERRCERLCAKRDEQFAAIIHTLPRQAIMPACAKCSGLASSAGSREHRVSHHQRSDAA